MPGMASSFSDCEIGTLSSGSWLPTRPALHYFQHSFEGSSERSTVSIRTGRYIPMPRGANPASYGKTHLMSLGLNFRCHLGRQRRQFTGNALHGVRSDLPPFREEFLKLLGCSDHC